MKTRFLLSLPLALLLTVPVWAAFQAGIVIAVNKAKDEFTLKGTFPNEGKEIIFKIGEDLKKKEKQRGPRGYTPRFNGKAEDLKKGVHIEMEFELQGKHLVCVGFRVAPPPPKKK